MSLFSWRAASSVFVQNFRCISVKHLPSGCLRSPVLAQQGGSTDRAELSPCPPPYRHTLPSPPKPVLVTAQWVQPYQPHALLWAGKASACPGREPVSRCTGSAAFSWQSGAGAAAQLSDMQRGGSRFLLFGHCPWGCQVFNLAPRAACFV